MWVFHNRWTQAWKIEHDKVATDDVHALRSVNHTGSECIRFYFSLSLNIKNTQTGWSTCLFSSLPPFTGRTPSPSSLLTNKFHVLQLETTNENSSGEFRDRQDDTRNACNPDRKFKLCNNWALFLKGLLKRCLCQQLWATTSLRIWVHPKPKRRHWL